MVSAIVAADENWGIGFNGDLLVHIPEDLKYFKKLTSEHAVVMGRKTWDSLPKKPLPDRLNIVISNEPKEILGDLSIRIGMEEAKARLQYLSEDAEWFVIGGGTIYKQLLPYCDRVYVTKIYKTYDNVDTYFPNLDQMEDWKVRECNEYGIYDGVTYQFLVYDRI